MRGGIGLMFNVEWSNATLFYDLYARIHSVWENTELAATGAEGPALASSINIGAFNLGKAIGAAAGAIVLGSGLGYQSVMLAGAGLAALALALVVWSVRSPAAAPRPVAECA